MQNIKELLKRYFGYDEFRPLQEEIIEHVVAGNDCFVLMPTGGGKSLCYQLPALKFKGLTLVISPLIALMKDQVDALKVCGVEAEFINSSLTPKQIATVFGRIRAGLVSGGIPNGSGAAGENPAGRDPRSLHPAGTARRVGPLRHRRALPSPWLGRGADFA